ncbi:MAG: hypothetical protein AB8B85_16815 [Paracoccaceae bacterium]
MGDFPGKSLFLPALGGAAALAAPLVGKKKKPDAPAPEKAKAKPRHQIKHISRATSNRQTLG